MAGVAAASSCSGSAMGHDNGAGASMCSVDPYGIITYMNRPSPPA